MQICTQQEDDEQLLSKSACFTGRGAACSLFYLLSVTDVIYWQLLLLHTCITLHVYHPLFANE